MKLLNTVFTIALFSFFASCTDSTDESSLDFSGEYTGIATCVHELDGTEVEELSLTIERQEGNSYLLFFEDDVTFTAVQRENSLVIEEQTANEGADFDVVTLSGSVQKTTEGILIESEHTVDDEGLTTCTIALTKV